jgi:PiT family inorganic phosphate transporter
VRVAAIGVAAPVAGAGVASVLNRVPVGRSETSLRRLHGGGVLVQSAAYAANDGQKMMAVGIVAASVSGWGGEADHIPLALLVAIAVCFAAGAVAGLRSIVGSLGGGVLRQRPRDEVSVEFASGVAVLGSAVLGAPVSMTQSIAGGLVGVGVGRGHRQVRWRVAAGLALAWIVTLPASAAVGAVSGLIVRWAGQAS